ncbi:MAG: S-adenosyl-L-methionine-dependent 2-deoxy-scyllo-inosamine dehydrogenase [Candidatus Aerophobetes bacterium ADurb.Bin490]|nr:MAG: S-adenosyl-L-methionine-dependent 2-deoxy-scyllo-inosamine dehydrogenase [Candidatus Aerophobetes bacterium ADurb.Bin490]
MKRFKKTYIEITNACNLSCDFCPGTKRKTGYMTAETFETILERIKGHSDNLYFHVMGEPLMHPQLGLFLDMCADKGFRVNITTNGILAQRLMELADKPALRQVSFSLHSLEGNNKSDTESYLNGIFDFIRAVKGKNVSVSLRLWNLIADEKNLQNQSIIDSFKQRLGYTGEIQQGQTPVNGIKIGDKVFLKQAERFEWPDINAKEVPGAAFCYGLRDQIAVFTDGTVVPCCLDAQGVMKLGNIIETPLQEIIDSPRAKAIYEGFTQRRAVEPLCQRCSFRKRFDYKLNADGGRI